MFRQSIEKTPASLSMDVRDHCLHQEGSATSEISTALQAISSATELRTAVASDVTQAIESLHGGSGLAPALQRHPQIGKSNGLHMRKGIEPTAARDACHQRPNRWSELHRSCSNYLKRNHECLTTMSKEWALQRWHHSPLLASITYRQVLDAVGCHAEYLLHTHPSIPGWEYLVPSAKDMEVLCHLGCRVRWSLVVSDATIWKTGFSNSLWKQPVVSRLLQQDEKRCVTFGGHAKRLWMVRMGRKPF